MSIEPLVSVIIPTYNRAGFLPEAICSVLNQSYRNIEIIIVDDGSSDNTRTVLDPFQEKIHYIFTENSGPAHARNTGMKAASGKYLSFLDSDDLYLPYKLELQVAFMEAYSKVGLVYTEVTGFDDSGFNEEYHLRTYHALYNKNGWKYEDIFPEHGNFCCEAVKSTIPFYIGNLFKYVLLGPLVMTNTVLYPREILNTVGYQNEDYHLAEEYEHTLRICKHYQVGFLNIPTYRLRYHDAQISLAREPWTKERELTAIETEKVLLKAVIDWGLDDKSYYAENQHWLNPRLAELYHCLGEKWLEYGRPDEARKCFRKGLFFDPASKINRQYLYLSYLPALMRRGYHGVFRRFKK